MTTREELESRRLNEAARIRLALNSMRTEAREKVKGGPGTVAFVKEDLCIGLSLIHISEPTRPY